MTFCLKLLQRKQNDRLLTLVAILLVTRVAEWRVREPSPRSPRRVVLP